MTEGAAWSARNGVELQQVPDSREERQNLYGEAYGQAITPAPGK